MAWHGVDICLYRSSGLHTSCRRVERDAVIAASSVSVSFRAGSVLHSRVGEEDAFVLSDCVLYSTSGSSSQSQTDGSAAVLEHRRRMGILPRGKRGFGSIDGCPRGRPIDPDSASEGVVDKPSCGLKLLGEVQTMRFQPDGINRASLLSRRPLISKCQAAAGIDADDEGQRHEPSVHLWVLFKVGFGRAEGHMWYTTPNSKCPTACLPCSADLPLPRQPQKPPSFPRLSSSSLRYVG
jgi:hypothetical protein